MSTVKRNNLNVENFPQLFDSEVAITKEQVVSNVYHVFIDNEIGFGTTYRSLITLLNSATEEDTFVFHIASPGGEAETAMQIYLAMLNTRAHTVAQIDGYAASAATFFVMAAKQVLVAPHAYMMVHGASCGNWGDMARLKSEIDFQYDRMLNILLDVYDGFMTKEEILNMVENHHDINMGADEIISRLQKREELRQEKEDELELDVKEFLKNEAKTKPAKKRVSKKR